MEQFNECTAAKEKRLNLGVVPFVLIACLFSAGAAAAESFRVISLEEAVAAAQANDPWLVENSHSQDAVEAMSVAAGTMPDPRVSLGLANFPVDTFDIDQEPMTQIKVGVTQMIPRGDSLDLKRQQLHVLGGQFPYQRQDRRAKVTMMVGQLWLDAYKAQESIALIELDRPLFQQLVDVAEASYSTAMGKTRQQDIIRAQLELTRLDDRLTMLRQKQEMFTEKLAEWYRGYFSNEYLGSSSAQEPGSELIGIERELPDIAMRNSSVYTSEKRSEPMELYGYFGQHPSVRAIEQKIEASNLGIDLARESYKPMWGVSASYGYREDAPSGAERADFLSLGVSFDLPFFTKNRQDKQVESAVSQAEAVKTRKWARVRNMTAEFEKARAQLNRLTQRQQLYRIQLLPQMHEQAEASLTAYTNDDGDFAEVVRARIAELNARISALDIDVERLKAIIQLNYLFTTVSDDKTEGEQQ